jgi:hypothetical protein
MLAGLLQTPPGWAFGVPRLVLLIGSATYAALQWIVIGFRGK